MTYHIILSTQRYIVTREYWYELYFIFTFQTYPITALRVPSSPSNLFYKQKGFPLGSAYQEAYLLKPLLSIALRGRGGLYDLSLSLLKIVKTRRHTNLFAIYQLLHTLTYRLSYITIVLLVLLLVLYNLHPGPLPV